MSVCVCESEKEKKMKYASINIIHMYITHFLCSHNIENLIFYNNIYGYKRLRTDIPKVATLFHIS